jgi:hypothetical protein
VFHVSEVCLESNWGTARASWEGAGRARGRWMGCAAHLGSCGRGVLVLVPGPSRTERDRGGGQGEGVASTGLGEARQTGKGMRAGRDEADGKGLQRYGGRVRCVSNGPI